MKVSTLGAHFWGRPNRNAASEIVQDVSLRILKNRNGDFSEAVLCFIRKTKLHIVHYYNLVRKRMTIRIVKSFYFLSVYTCRKKYP